jgi:hypothetical protein
MCAAAAKSSDENKKQLHARSRLARHFSADA